MKFIIVDNERKVADLAKEIFVEEIQKNPSLHLCLATGSTPVELYKQLIEANKKKEISFKKIKSFNLDNYLGLKTEDKNNYEYFMREQLFDHIDMPESNWIVPPSDPQKAQEFCFEYEEIINREGIDLCLLGVGENGHIAFNEPADVFNPYTQIVDLTEDTIRVNSRFFERVEDVPTQAITMGIGTIMKAKKIVLLATGERKRETMKKLYREKKVDPNFPISLLYLHPNVTIITDSIEK